MKPKFIAMLSAAAALASAHAASAADIPARMPTKAPAAVVAQTWTGVYVGVTAGGVWGRAKNTWVDPAFPALLDLTVSNGDVSGFIGGGTIGANWQFGSIVLGVEGDGSWTNARASSNGLAPFVTTNVFDVRQYWIATARGRVGYAFDGWLVYVTGGGAWAEIGEKVTTAAGLAFTDYKIMTGWTVGAGAEVRLGGGWSAKAEYLYVDFSDKVFFSPFPVGLISLGLTNHIARVGLNYNFAPMLR